MTKMASNTAMEALLGAVTGNSKLKIFGSAAFVHVQKREIVKRN